jgi:hypothetical protein
VSALGISEIDPFVLATGFHGHYFPPKTANSVGCPRLFIWPPNCVFSKFRHRQDQQVTLEVK